MTWTLSFYDARGESTSRGMSVDTLTDAVRRVLLRFERHEEIRYATVAMHGRPFALVAVASSFKATCTAIAVDERALSDKERRALGHIENMLRSGVRVHLRGTFPQWHLHRPRPEVDGRPSVGRWAGSKAALTE